MQSFKTLLTTYSSEAIKHTFTGLLISLPIRWESDHINRLVAKAIGPNKFPKTHMADSAGTQYTWQNFE